MKLHIVTPFNANAQTWTEALQRAEPRLEVTAEVTALHTATLPTGKARPDLMVVEASAPADFAALEVLAHGHPQIGYLFVAEDLSPETLLRAMRAGVREVLPAPTSDDAVVAAVRRLARKTLPEVPVQRSAHVIGFVSCKGGSGATFVAANVAHLLARRGEQRVALLDLNLQFGDAALFVTSEHAASNVAEVARNIHRLDRELLQSAMTPAGPGLWVLPAPDDPAQAGDVTPEHVRAILDLAVEMFDYVVIDLGRTINAVTLRALDVCQPIYVVLQLTLPFIRDGRRLLEVFRSLGYGAGKVRWIVNRHEKGGDISIDDLKKTLGVGELITLPNQYDVVASSVNQGVPVERLAPNSAIARALRELADTIASPAVPQRGSWFSGLLRGTRSANKVGNAS